MIIKLRKMVLTSLVFAMLIGYFQLNTVNAQDIVSTDDNTLTINNSDLGYNGIIETVYNDVIIHKYKITEYGDSYYLLFDTEKDKVYIDNYELSTKEYYDLSSKQLSNMKNKSVKNLSMVELANSYPVNVNAISKYDQLHDAYVANYKNHFHDQNSLSRCMHCPLNTTSVPKSGYKSTEYNIGSKSNKMQIALTSSVIAAVAAYCTWGLSQIASALIAGFLEFLGVSVSFAQVDYHAYQSFHNVCWNAVKERHLIWMTDTETNKSKSKNEYHYFYSSKPY